MFTAMYQFWFSKNMMMIMRAPLQENYSEVLRTPAQLKRAVLRWEKTQVTSL